MIEDCLLGSAKRNIQRSRPERSSVSIPELMECVFAIHGLEKYIPRSVIQTYIIPFAIQKPLLYCQKCGKILYFGSKGTPIPSTWHISWKANQTKISCTECFKNFTNKKK